MTLPNFFIIGSPRAGTTSLHRYLGQHPEIFMSPVKEPRFYNRDSPAIRQRAQMISDPAAYEGLFDGVRGETAVGEATPTYLTTRAVPERIRADVPDARFVISLRQPAERAFAAFTGRRREGQETRTCFMDALRDEERRQLDPGEPAPILQQGYCGRHLQQWLRVFDRDRFRWHLFEDFTSDPKHTVIGIFEFLGVDASFEPDVSVRHNPSAEVPNPLLRVAWTRTLRLRRRVGPLVAQGARDVIFARMMRSAAKPSIPPDIRAELTRRYRDDILLLQDLIDRDLTHWL